ncbi:DNA polymerase Y family protein [Ponticoccus sp. SC2-23]|uniref:DinB/UmuC family translesion DNA polymerase n=1 Tax=Alexandriicola marinus TaxID=2081710 RepID=UPI000FDB0881|nr:DNA polymerase Y family protein [Ponticoccus sp. SC6-9]MBM1225399.1 DNA polymerase Y family protein [Ponticoccus sp. SC6-15]MBM1227582.1 DNA polymerase Y family protein [Ponticoccus sp. SC6-38]MBM1234780.1 DNA polymerase Y family protein [Ponticoccus sp. SC6-45]MBM1238084.1 DNA polymerase Y family protein [Ponticoccus sp. SC6-49]MBM1244283.1 DNA polymerase Y family protein [Ponticoccus sp. SC2-64]MBM1248304.1 DNA polymerase Y family protein [Ponticoccus sp. SC6-42]MBM1252484.1 DNA polymer
MSREDKLPVLATLPRPARHQTEPDRTAPADLARAIAALREAEAAITAPAPRDGGDLPRPNRTETDDTDFTPVGPPRPRWRAGPDAPSDMGAARPGRAGVAAGAVAPPGDRDPLARRFLSLHMPDFAIERWQRHAARTNAELPQDIPHALAMEGPHGPVIHALNRAARLAGIELGARVVDMRALVPELRLDYADPGGDAAALERLMRWCRRWCPWTVVDGLSMHGAGVVMDTTGSDHLWGGEAAMLRDIEARLSALGISAQLAIAPTRGAAWALARLGGVRECCAADELAARMAPLPVAALRLTGETRLLLQRLGLKTVGDLAAVPRLSLARRFSRAALPENPLLRLDQMMGRLAEPVASPDDPPRFAVQSQLSETVMDPVPLIPGLCAELCEGLAAAGFGARRITLTIYRSDGEVSEAAAATSQPSRDPAHLARLFEGKLDRIDPGFGFDLITLAASQAEKMTTAQARLDGGPEAGPDTGRLIDRLSARFGAQALRRPAMRESHIPERREAWAPAMAGLPRRPEPAPRPRPLRLLEPPEQVTVVHAVPDGPPAQFIWRRQTHRVTRYAGPERIAPEWWADRPGTRLRDYYRIEDHQGARFWIYREGILGDGRGGSPDWFIHGIFG